MSTSDPGAIPGPIVIPACVMVRLNWSQTGGRIAAHNILHGIVGGGFTATTAIANAVFTALNSGGAWDALAAFLHPGGGFDGVTLLDLRSPSLASVDSTAAGVLGTSGDNSMPPAVSVVITERTDLTGPANRGRIYIPLWAANAATNNGDLQSTAQAALQAWADTIPAALSGSGLTLALGHPARAAYTGLTGVAHPARAAGAVPVTSLVVRNARFDSQRKRAGRS